MPSDFAELKTVELNEDRFVVISEKNSDISIAQKVIYRSNTEKPMHFFLKNAIACTPEKALEIGKALVDCAERALSLAESRKNL
jgi:hypothetical protein